MPSFEHHGATIYYETSGEGFPILTFAPAGLQSVIDVWSQPSAPINPIAEFSSDFQVITMDQRNAGGPFSCAHHGAGQLALLRRRSHGAARPSGH